MGEGASDPAWAQGNVELILNSTDPSATLAKTDILVLVSEHEGLPISLLEGMAAGCVLIASGVGGIPELIRQGENGFLLESTTPEELASKITTIQERDDIDQMKKNSLTLFEKMFSPSVFASKHRNIYLDQEG